MMYRNLALALLLAGCHSSHSTTDGGGTKDGSTPAGDGFSATDGAINPADSGVVPGADGGDVNTATGQSVLQRGHDLYRSGTFTEPGLTKAAAATMAADATFNANATFPANGHTQGQGMASVLYLEQGPAAAGCPANVTGCTATSRAAGAGVFFAFPPLGSNPNVFAIDETSGKPVWTQFIDGGNDGIRGTPVVDPASRRVFFVTGPNPHVVHALSVDDGSEVKTGGWPVTISSTTMTYGTQTFDSSVQNEHGALLLMNNILYLPFGGENGDGGNYLGWIVAIDITDPTKLAGWATKSSKSGIWASGGLAADGTYVFGVTGNNASGLTRPDLDSEEVVRVKGLAQFTRDAQSLYVPTEWAQWDQSDLDFGSASPSFVPLPTGSNPSSVLVAPGKGGRVFILDGANLSSGTYPTPGGELVDLVVSGTVGPTVYTSPTVYSSASGIHAVINVGGNASDNAVGCPSGTTAKSQEYKSILIAPGQTPIAKTVWCASNQSGQGGGIDNYPPISTTTDGVSANALVWFMDGGQLTAVDGDTGAHVFTTTGPTCDSLFALSYPIAVKNRIVVAALGHLCSWSPGGN